MTALRFPRHRCSSRPLAACGPTGHLDHPTARRHPVKATVLRAPLRSVALRSAAALTWTPATGRCAGVEPGGVDRTSREACTRHRVIETRSPGTELRTTRGAPLVRSVRRPTAGVLPAVGPFHPLRIHRRQLLLPPLQIRSAGIEWLVCHARAEGPPLQRMKHGPAG
jgi:hypothetical protein